MVTGSEVLQVVLTNWAIMLALVSLLWAFCTWRRDTSIIDRFWGPMCATPGVLTLLQLAIHSTIALLLVSLSCIWALRLAWHITRRNWNAGEDFRYAEDASPALTHAASPLAALLKVFFGQATIAWLVSAPIQLGQFQSAGIELSILGWLGILVWVIGFLFEAVGDWQLRRFKANPANKGKVLDQGLWAWTRHPNYFGDATVGFGLFLIAAEAPLGIYSLFGPLMMLYFLVRVTGKELTEKLMLERRPDYRAYTERTSGFFPLPPKRRSG
jgi:steroid 5-alpha reductase family enzyme